MFDIGMPEFMIIAIVALIVLGPERLPEVMGKAGRAYRQLREMSNQLTGEFQRQWEEGMREVEEVTSTVNTAWQDATNSTSTAAALPPPRLAQVPAPRLAPAAAPEAGPWVLPAWHRDTAPETEPLGTSCPKSPSALPRRSPDSQDFDALMGVGGPSLMGPAPSDEEGAQFTSMGNERDERSALPAAAPDAAVPAPAARAADVAPGFAASGVVSAGEPEPVFPAQREPSAYELPDLPAADLVGLPAGAGAAQRPAANGAANRADRMAVPDGEPRGAYLTERERTVLELLQTGAVSFDNAAAYLEISPAQLSTRLAQLALRG